MKIFNPRGPSVCLLGLVLFLPLNSLAQPTIFMDSRALGMGGVGVASARPAAAVYVNPALLSLRQPKNQDKFGALLPSAYVMDRDGDDLRGAIDDFQGDYLDPFNEAIQALRSSFGTSEETINKVRAASSARRLNEKLQDIDGDNADGNAGVGVSLVRPSRTLGVGLFTSVAAQVVIEGQYRDRDLLQGIINDVGGYTSSADIPYNPDIDTLESSVRGVGLARSQVGVALSHNLRINGHDYAIGVTPKYVDLRVYDYSSTFGEYEFDDLKDEYDNDGSFNFDLGLASYIDNAQTVIAGISVVNVIPKDINTAPTNGTGLTSASNSIKVSLSPVLLAGLAYHDEGLTLATDLELTKTSETFSEGDKQAWSVGLEYDAWPTVQVRTGARVDLINPDKQTLATAGLGVDILDSALEVAAFTSVDLNTFGLSLQFGLSF